MRNCKSGTESNIRVLNIDRLFRSENLCLDFQLRISKSKMYLLFSCRRDLKAIQNIRAMKLQEYRISKASKEIDGSNRVIDWFKS